jgi:hypothetical protein
VGLLIVPAASAGVMETLSVGLELGFVVFSPTCPVPLLFQVMWTWGNGVPLLLPLIVPLVADQVMPVLVVQFPEIV